MLQSFLSNVQVSRQRSGGLPTGVAPHVDSDMFRLRTQTTKKKAEDWTHHLSVESQSRTKATLKASAHNSAAISLGTARPMAQYYPWESMLVTRVAVDEKNGSNPQLSTAMYCAKGSGAYDLGVALNYGHAGGSAQLLRFITEHVEMVHKPQYDDWECRLTCGNSSALEILLRMLVNRGEYILVEAYSYPGTIEAAKGLGINLLSVQIDDQGLVPEDLDEKLCRWDHGRGPKPSLLYMIPSGQNPTGTTQPLERRKMIYQIAQRHDLIIIEDDPYFYLRLESDSNCCDVRQKVSPSLDDFVTQLPCSYLSLDISGRVLRLDSTSKILAPGLRCGWVTGCAQLVDKFVCHTELSTVSPSGPSQVLLYKLLDENWGHDGFIKWLRYLSTEYQRRRDTMIKACSLYLRSDICSWSVPLHGMFMWAQVNAPKRPSAPGECELEGTAISALEIEQRIFARAMEKGVALSKGSWFAAPETELTQVHFRMTFAAATESDLTVAIQRFAAAVDEEFK